MPCIIGELIPIDALSNGLMRLVKENESGRRRKRNWLGGGCHESLVC